VSSKKICNARHSWRKCPHNLHIFVFIQSILDRFTGWTVRPTVWRTRKQYPSAPGVGKYSEVHVDGKSYRSQGQPTALRHRACKSRIDVESSNLVFKKSSPYHLKVRDQGHVVAECSDRKCAVTWK